MIGFREFARAELVPRFIAVSALTLAELVVGPVAVSGRADQTCRAERLRRVEASFEILGFDIASAHSYARVYSAVLSIGRKARGSTAVDLMIAATALAYELPLYTLNAADLRGLGDLIEIVDPS